VSVAGSACLLIEQRLRRSSRHDGVGHCVGVTLVSVARLVDAVLELHAAALLHDVCGLVRRRVEVWSPAERHRIADSIGVCTELTCGDGRGRSLMGAHAGYVVVAEACLDLRKVRQRRARAGHALGGDLRRSRGLRRRRRLALDRHNRLTRWAPEHRREVAAGSWRGGARRWLTRAVIELALHRGSIGRGWRTRSHALVSRG
jgi:hypothetical protein